MTWILIAIVSGSILVSEHSTEEACLGRKALLARRSVASVMACVELPKAVDPLGPAVVPPATTWPYNEGTSHLDFLVHPQ